MNFYQKRKTFPILKLFICKRAFFSYHKKKGFIL
nr:MAG TPA: hypothetical protein [Bacteriophage sp.]